MLVSKDTSQHPPPHLPPSNKTPVIAPVLKPKASVVVAPAPAPAAALEPQYPILTPPALPLGSQEITWKGSTAFHIGQASDASIRAAQSVLVANHATDLAAWSRISEQGLAFFSRCLELGLKVRVSDLGAVCDKLEATPAYAAALKRLVRALGTADADPLLGGRLLSAWRSPTPVFCQMPKAAGVLAQLNALSGLAQVRRSLAQVYAGLLIAARREALGLKFVKPTLHMTFCGPPGTGKTTVARIYAKMLHATGALPNATVLEVTQDDLVAGYAGQTAIKTRQVLERAKGGVLFIDEAYTLAQGGAGAKECVATLVKYMEEYRDETAVVFAGYTSDMRQLLKANAGLASRIGEPVYFESFSDKELARILRDMATAGGYKVTPALAHKVAEGLGRQRAFPDFANARAVRNELDRATERAAVRLQGDIAAGTQAVVPLEAADFASDDTDKIRDAADALAQLNDLEGLAEVKASIRGLMCQVAANKRRTIAGLKTQPLSLHACFTGNPGTGKTTVARLYARILAGQGVLTRGHLIEVDRSHLVADYVGQTATKTRDVLMSAMGGVLFIDEAYALAGSGHGNDYGAEALTTITKFMEDHRENLVVVFAGYPGDMQKLAQTNVGMGSRVDIDIQFPDYDDGALARILRKQARDRGYILPPKSALAIVRQHVAKRGTAAFGNAREMRRVLDGALRKQSVRLQNLEDQHQRLTPAQLSQLIEEDFAAAA